MAVAPDSTAPYAPTSAVLEVVNRYRRGLPAPITADVLTRAGITQSLVPRTLQALQILDLIDTEGRPTETLEGLRRSPEPELQKKLADWLNAAYADVLQYIDPATADDVAIRDAFRNYNPVGQQPRMVTLFTGLYAAAGVRSSERAPSSPRTSRAPRTAPPRSRQQTPKPFNNPKFSGHSRVPGLATIPAALGGLLESLPDPDKGWTQQKRDKFYETFGTVLDFCFPIVAEEPSSDEEELAEE